MQLFYASHDGHTRRIAERLASGIDTQHAPVTAQDLADGVPDLSAISGLIVLVAAIRYGKHLPPAMQFLKAYARIEKRPPLVFISVNLTARKPEKRSAEGSTYLRKAIHKFALKPVLAEAIAGRLDYPRYRWFDRQMIRFIMFLTGGPTDPSLTIEFTDWQRVDALALEIAALDTVAG